MKMRFWTGCLWLLYCLLAARLEAQEKFRFPIGESSKTLSYGPLWVAAISRGTLSGVAAICPDCRAR